MLAAGIQAVDGGQVGSAPRAEDGTAPSAPPTSCEASWLRWRAVFLTLCTTGVFAASYSYITFAPTFLREVAGASLVTHVDRWC